MSQTCEIIKGQILLDTPRNDGSILREELQLLEKMTKKIDPKLITPSIPFPCLIAYNTFLKLRHSAGDKSISYSEIKAYIDVTESVLSPSEVEAIMLFDSTALAQRYEIYQKQAQASINK